MSEESRSISNMTADPGSAVDPLWKNVHPKVDDEVTVHFEKGGHTLGRGTVLICWLNGEGKPRFIVRLDDYQPPPWENGNWKLGRAFVAKHYRGDREELTAISV